MKSVLDEAALLLEALATEEFVPADRLTKLAKRARRCADQLDPRSQRLILATLNELIEAMNGHLKQTKAKLGQLQTNRRALKKFGHLRRHATGQRYYNSI